jgi:PAS domain S-box-containing protein
VESRDPLSPGTPLSVLIVEDSEDDVALLLRELRKGGYEPNYLNVCTPEDMRSALAEMDWDLIISDWSMPRFNGLDAFHLARERNLDAPFIIVSGTIGEEIAVEALKAGVHDFMTKGMYARLLPAVERELREHAERRRRRNAELEVEHRRQQIAESERLLRLVIDSVPDGVAVIDNKGDFVLWNSGAELLLGMDSTPAEGDAATRYGIFHFDRVTPHPPAGQVLARTLQGEEIDRHEVFVRHPGAPDGAYLSLNSRVLRDAGGNIRGAVGVFHDLTREKAANEQLMISDRMASIGMLAAGVAHEINNPLAAIMANLELAHRDLTAQAPDSELVDMLNDARIAAERVRLIVRDLKIFSRHEEVRSGPVDVNRVLESSIRMAWNEIRHRAQLQKDFAPNLVVQGAESRLGQVFLNLMVNAAQAIPEGKVESHLIRVTSRIDERGWVCVEVSDSGSGITADQLGQLFRPFFTTKPEGIGTGLGLVICHRIVTALGGEIQVESKPGQGSTFRVLLPPAHGTAASPQPTAPAPAPRRARVLVVDDEPQLAPAIGRMLEAEHEVSINTSAADALGRVLGGERFDLILCDLMMPQMTGMQLHAALVEKAPTQAERMVFLTGGAFTPGARAFLEAVPNEYLEKPFDREQLRALVNRKVSAA